MFEGVDWVGRGRERRPLQPAGGSGERRELEHQRVIKTVMLGMVWYKAADHAEVVSGLLWLLTTRSDSASD